MTTTGTATTTAATGGPAQVGAYRLTATRLLRSELIRFVTVRSNVVTVGALAALMLVIGVIAAATPGAPPPRGSPRPTRSPRCSPAPRRACWSSGCSACSWARGSTAAG